MEEAKASVQKFLSKDGKHDTTVHQQHSPAVQHETVSRGQHDRATTAVDREVHQDHYVTREQPISHTETLPEQHHHKLIPVEHRNFEHGNDNDTKQRLAETAAQYKSHSNRVEGERTTSTAPSVAGEHVHHHVHETVQPIVQKQTVEPHVVHTTVPVHEVHHNEAKHHTASALPAMTMDEFKKGGGVLTGVEEKLHHQHDGCPPEPIAGHQGGTSGMSRGTAGTTGANGATGATGAAGLASRDGKLARDERRVDSARDASSQNSRAGYAEQGPSVTGVDPSAAKSGIRGDPNTRGYADSAATSGQSGSGPTPASYGNDMHLDRSPASQTKKPSLLDRLNPRKDADGDGKPGFMK